MAITVTSNQMFKKFYKLIGGLAIFSILFFTATHLSKPVNAQTVDWLKQIHIPYEVEGRTVKTDVSGYVYLLGTTYGPDGRNAFLRKYDSNGNEVWVRQFGNGDFDPSGLAIKGSFLYISGVIGGYPDNMAVFKYDTSGNEMWETEFESMSDGLHSKIAVNESGIYLTGGEQHVFIVKLDENGNKLWMRQPVFNTHQGGMGIGINGSYVYATGFQYGSGRLGAFIIKYDFEGNEIWNRQFDTPDGASEGIVTNDGIYIAGFQDDIYHYDFDGNRIWAIEFGLPGCLQPSGIDADTSGVYITAGGSCLFPGETGAGNTDVFVAKLDVNGNLVWHLLFGSTGSDAGISVAVHGSSIYVAGIAGNDMLGQVDMGRITDGFIAKISQPNETPIANAGPDQTIIQGQQMTLSGSGSTDPDGLGDIVSYSWNFGDSVTANGITVNHIYSQAGVYTTTLIVTDTGGATGVDTATITVLTPAQATQNLINLVQTYNLQQGIENSLDAKLNAAIGALNDLNAHNNTAAVNALQAFASAVNAQRGSHITDAQADELIQDAQQILNTLM